MLPAIWTRKPESWKPQRGPLSSDGRREPGRPTGHSHLPEHRAVTTGHPVGDVPRPPSSLRFVNLRVRSAYNGDDCPRKWQVPLLIRGAMILTRVWCGLIRPEEGAILTCTPRETQPCGAENSERR